MKEREYVGMPVGLSAGPIKLNEETEEQVGDLIDAGKSTYFVELISLCLKGEKVEKSLKECLVKIMGGNLNLLGKWEGTGKVETVIEKSINRNWPKLILDRSCSKLVTVCFSEDSEAQILLQNNKVRDVFSLVVERSK